MTRVFTFREISERRVPRLADVLRLAARVRRQLARSPAIGHALTYGSTAHGGATRTSDVDFLCVFKPGQHDAAKSVVESLKEEARRLNVLMRAELFGEKNASRVRRFSGGALFIEALALAARTGGLIKGDPMPFVHTSPEPRETEAARYARDRKNAILRGALARPGSLREARHLTAALRAPVHLARKVLQTASVELETGARSEVVSLYRVHGARQAVALLEEVVFAQARYARDLVAQLRRPNRGAYEDSLVRLRKSVLASLAMLDLHGGDLSQ